MGTTTGYMGNELGVFSFPLKFHDLKFTEPAANVGCTKHLTATFLVQCKQAATRQRNKHVLTTSLFFHDPLEMSKAAGKTDENAKLETTSWKCKVGL